MSSPPRSPLRGEVWDFRLDPTEGYEQGGNRPCLVISNNHLNQSRAELVIIVPMSTRLRAINSHIVVEPPEGGVTSPSDIMCEHVRSLSTDRLIQYRGDVSRNTILSVEAAIRRLLAMNP
jgi:mRNA interferase MazF